MANNLMTINNQFEFNFPVDFVSETVEKRYFNYLKSKRKIHTNLVDFLNSTILNISFPAITFNTVSNKQNLHRKKINWKAVDNIYDLFEDKVTVTVQDVDSHINYFILLDILSEKYLDTDRAYDESVIVTVVDENRNALYQIQFRNVMWTGMDGISLAYNEQTMGNSTFTLNFTYNFIDITWFDKANDFVKDNLD